MNELESWESRPQWEPVSDHNSIVRCPVCGQCENWEIVVNYNFCPFCGTRMHNFDHSG